ncbi:MAG TPA: hypothetical protein VKC55_03470 [Actinomycetota bacterium]|jgi:hypothetical protein|nr:hypothetical protein [Actinomycetota bacterium]
MSNAEVIREQALALATSGADRDGAIRELERSAAGRRVSVVRARQQMETSLGDEMEQPNVARAIELLDEVLVRLPA